MKVTGASDVRDRAASVGASACSRHNLFGWCRLMQNRSDLDPRTGGRLSSFGRIGAPSSSALVRVLMLAAFSSSAAFSLGATCLELGAGSPPPTSAMTAAVPTVTFTSATSSAGEGAGQVQVEVQLSAAATTVVSVPITVGGTATQGADYVLLTNPVVFNVGATSSFVRVDIVQDTQYEGPQETVALGLGAPTGATPGATLQHVLAIVDDEPAPRAPVMLPPALVVSTQSIVFPQTNVGASAGVRSLQITNPHTAPIQFLGLAPSTGTGSGFLVRYPGLTLPIMLAPGQALTAEVEFLPVSPGPAVSTYVVRQGFGGIPPSQVRFEGIAIGERGHEVVIHCGEASYVSPERTFWSSDFGALSSEGYFASYIDVLGTEDDVLYHQSRWGQTVVYRFDLPNGLYEFGFRSWEPVHSTVGARVFDVSVEGQVLFDDVDLFAAAGSQRAWVSPKRRVQVNDGTVDIRFDASSARALVSAIELRSIPIIHNSTPSLHFGSVDQGTYRQLDIELTNTGLAPGRATSLQIFPGSSGSASEFSVEVAGALLTGGPNTSNFVIDLPLPVGQLVRIPVIFTPTQHRDNDLSLRLNLAVGDSIEVDVHGTGGANVGWGFLHPEIEIDPVLVIDYDSSGSEPVDLIGGSSHTHEPGRYLTSYEWRVGGSVVGTTATVQASLPLGQSFVELTVADSNSPPEQAMARRPVAVHPVGAVPGILARYYDGSVAGEVFLLDNVPAAPDYISRQSQLQTPQVGTTVGNSPFSGDVMVRWTANFQLAAQTTLSFVASGGTARLVLVDGQSAANQVVLAAGVHSFDVRFAVADVSGLPLQLDVLSNSAPFPGFVARLTHAEGALAPIIHSMPTTGIELGGNDVVIEGFAYFPPSQVVVNWGTTAITSAQFVSFSAERIHLLSPPGTGLIPVSVTTPNGTSNVRTYQYSSSGPVPIRWTVLFDRMVDVIGPTRVAWGPDGRLWVALIDGSLRAIRYDDQWNPTSAQYYAGVSGRTNKDVLGLTFDPFDVYDPLNPASPVVYVAHGEHYQTSGSPSNFTGEVSRLTGPAYDSPVAVVTGLPTSNHDHSVNGIAFDDNGDLLIAVGGNTNAGVRDGQMGDLPESPHSGAILKAFTSRPSFDGTVTLLDRQTLQVIDDQRFGEAAIVAPGCQLEVFAPGVRNPFDLLLHSNGYIYATDNGPNLGYGPASTGLSTHGGVPHPDHPDEILLVERGNYYGHPNRARGVDDPRQLLYRNELSQSIPHQFTQRMAHVASSTNGLEEYRATAFGGQLRGNLLVMRLLSGMRFFELTQDGRSVVDPIPPLVPGSNDGLDLAVAPSGAIVVCDYFQNEVRVQVPDDIAAIGLAPYDVFPARGPNVNGVRFELGGSGFGPAATTSVLFNGVSAVLTSVTPKRIRGIVPAQPVGFTGPVDVNVNSAAQRVTMTSAYRYIPAQRGQAPGFWKNSAPLPFALGEVAAVEHEGGLYLFGRGDTRTLRYDALLGAWQSNFAQRPFAGSRHAAEVAGGRIFLLGGVDAGSPGRVQIYDPAADTWSLGAPMPWAGDAVATAVIGGRIYAAGGLVGSSTVSNFAVYDPPTNVWTSLGALPIGVHHASAGTDGARFYVFGGRQGGLVPQAGLQHVQVYDPAAATWATSQTGQVAQLPLARSAAGRAVWYRGQFFVFGGVGLSSTFAEVHAYDPATNTWRRDASLPTARQGHGAVLFQDRVFVLGGGLVPGSSGSATAEVFKRP
jgi:glucose/arabinose dehydrogenase